MSQTIMIGASPSFCGTAFDLRKIENSYDIDHNQGSFWIYGGLCEVNLLIAKDTPEGKALELLILKPVPDKELEQYLDSIILKHIEPETIRSFLISFKKEVFQRGYKQAIKEFRLWIGLDEDE